MVDSDSFRQPVVRSGGGVRRPAAPPRRTPFPEVESLVALVSPSPTKDASSIGDSNRNTTSGFVVTSFHGTRSHDRGTHGERIQSPVRHRLAAKVSAVQTKLRRCPDAQASHLFSKFIAKDCIAVTQQVARKLVKGKGLAQLLSRPLRGRVGGHIEAEYGADHGPIPEMVAMNATK